MTTIIRVKYIGMKTLSSYIGHVLIYYNYNYRIFIKWRFRSYVCG